MTVKGNCDKETNWKTDYSGFKHVWKKEGDFTPVTTTKGYGTFTCAEVEVYRAFQGEDHNF